MASKEGPTDALEEDQGSENGQAPEEVTTEQLLEDERDRYLRMAAEFDNYRKRTEREMAEVRHHAADGVMLSLLEVVDNLDRAIDASDACSAEELATGMQAIRGQMRAILEREGIAPIETVGLAFDPFHMEAVMRMPSDDVAEGDVVSELQRGYRGRGYVLRPNKVIVSAGPAEPTRGPEADTDGAGDDVGDENRIDSRK